MVRSCLASTRCSSQRPTATTSTAPIIPAPLADQLGKKDQLVLDMDRFLKLAPQAPEADKAQAVVKAAKR